MISFEINCMNCCTCKLRFIWVSGQPLFENLYGKELHIDSAIVNFNMHTFILLKPEKRFIGLDVKVERKSTWGSDISKRFLYQPNQPFAAIKFVDKLLLNFLRYSAHLSSFIALWDEERHTIVRLFSNWNFQRAVILKSSTVSTNC